MSASDLQATDQSASDLPSTDQEWIALGREVLDVEAQGLIQVRDGLDQSFVRALDLMDSCGGRVVVTGVGKSGLVGRKIAATLSSTGTPAYFLHPVEGAHGDLGMIREGDVVLAISNSGETDELNGIIPTLASLGVKLIALTGNGASSLSRMCHVTVSTRVSREACPFDLAPTASTTATLAVGDALAVCLIRRKSFGTDDFQRFHPGGILGQRLCREVSAYMQAGNLPAVEPETPFREALNVLNQGGLGTLIIHDRRHKLEGILTDGDVRRLVCSTDPDMSAPVSRYMTVRPLTGRPGQSAATVLDIMETHTVTVLPIVDETEQVLGLVHLHDLLGKGRLKFSRNGG